jgi:puromycin-sensitive aminopeptidase
MLVSADGSKAQKERVATVVAHELAHQWFGNLVTMAWWSDLWLNESFATYMATWVVNKIFPEWAADTQFVFYEGSRAYQLDALRSSHPIEMSVRDVREVDGIFDAISYSKGAMVLRMTAKFIGDEGLQQGLMDYLSRYSLASATSVQLWECLSGPAAPNLKAVLQSWTQVQGYPYVQASFDRSTQQLTLTQNRFLVMNDVKPEENESLWQIPMYYTYGTAAGGDTQMEPLLMVDRTATVSVPDATWVKVNSDQIAFCRVQYTEEMLQALVVAVRTKSINGTDRYSLIADLAAFARGGYCDTAQVLTLLAHYAGEDNFVVWCEVVELEKKLRFVIADASSEVKEAFDAYCRRLYRPAMQGHLDVDADNTNHRAEQVRCMLFERLLVCKDPEVLAKARWYYEQKDISPIPLCILEAVYSLRVSEGGAAALAEVKALITNTTYAEARTHYLSALAAIPNPETGVADTFEFLLTDAVQSQDVTTVLLGFALRADTQRYFAQELIAKWPRLAQKLPSVVLVRLVKMVEHICDAAVVAPLQAFFAGLSEEMQSRLRMTFQQGIEGLQCNAAWARRDANSIAQYLLQVQLD